MDSSDDDIPGLESVSGSEVRPFPSGHVHVLPHAVYCGYPCVQFVEDSEDESDEGFLSPEEERPKGAHCKYLPFITG